MSTRRQFVRDSALLAGGAFLLGDSLACRRSSAPASAAAKSRVVGVAVDNMLVDMDYDPAAVHRAFEAGLRELTGERTLAHAWSSLVSPKDVVGIKINCIGAPRISSSLASINETIACWPRCRTARSSKCTASGWKSIFPAACSSTRMVSPSHPSGRATGSPSTGRGWSRCEPELSCCSIDRHRGAESRDPSGGG